MINDHSISTALRVGMPVHLSGHCCIPGRPLVAKASQSSKAAQLSHTSASKVFDSIPLSLHREAIIESLQHLLFLQITTNVSHVLKCCAFMLALCLVPPCL